MLSPCEVRRTCAEFRRQQLVDRRAFLRAGAVGTSGLTLASLLRGEALGAVDANNRSNSVIILWMRGGPSHIDMYDPKPDAPVEFRGEFGTIRTNLPGLDLCEHMPLQAKIADKMAVIRGIKWRGKHDPYELLSGYPSARSGEIRTGEKWPVLGAVASRVRGNR